MESTPNTHESERQFKKFSPEDTTIIRERFLKVRGELKGLGYHPFVTYEINGKKYRLGGSTVENSLITSLQFYAALAASSGIEDEEELKKVISGDSHDLSELIERKLLADLKIIDLGCGHCPTFSFLSRKLGAEVYMVDMLPPEAIGVTPLVQFTPADKEEMQKWYIQADLSLPKSIKLINERTGGVNFVTEANLNTDRGWKSDKPPLKLEKVAKGLLNEDGVYFDGEGMMGKFKHSSEL